MRYYKDYEADGYREDDYVFGDDRDQEHEERKHKAALYIRAHYEELMQDEDYKKAYNKIVDQFAREYYYTAFKQSVALVTEEQRENESANFDFVIKVKGKEEMEQYKDDAVYIVEWVKAGKPFIVYKD